jgi:hypothetical protein
MENVHSTYEEFTTELCAKYLPADWEENVHAQIFGMRLGKNVMFWDFY